MTTADEVQAFADMLRSHDGDQMAADMLAPAARRIRELERAAGQVRVSDQPDTSAKIDGSSPVPAAPISCHDHGNCELCDQIERRLAEARAAKVPEGWRQWHDQLGAMIDQVGQPDYSLRELVEGMRQIRDSMLDAARRKL